MKSAIVFTGLAALGAASLHAQTSQWTSKPFTVSAGLRGFYDDNYVTRSEPNDLDTFGFEISPSITYSRIEGNTSIGLSYAYGLKYYEESSDTDQSHTFNANLDHAFSDSTKLTLSETFAIAQEPEIRDGIANTLYRSEGDNIRNNADIKLAHDFSERLGTLLGYGIGYYNYDDTGAGSRSALLDRIEHAISLDLRMQVAPQTVGVLGYGFGITDFTSSYAVSPALGAIRGSQRDNDSHKIYVGADRNFSDTLNASVRVGAEVVDYDLTGKTETNPYANASVNWTYAEASTLQVGVVHRSVATDVALFTGADVTLDQQVTSIYGSIRHQITGGFYANLYAQAQFGELNGGGAGVDGSSEDLFIFSATVDYELNKFVTLEAGYNYDNYESDIAGRSFDRNRIFAGVRGTF